MHLLSLINIRRIFLFITTTTTTTTSIVIAVAILSLIPSSSSSSFSFVPSCNSYLAFSAVIPQRRSLFIALSSSPAKRIQLQLQLQLQLRLYQTTTADPIITSCNNNDNIIMSSSSSENNNIILQRLSPSDVSLEIKDPVNPKALEQAKDILEELSNGTEGTVNAYKLLQVAQRLGDVDSKTCTTNKPENLIVSKQLCEDAYNTLTNIERNALTNMYKRIKAFAVLQRLSVIDTEMNIPGGKAGHTVSPCQGK
jgi:hypothetical protein